MNHQYVCIVCGKQFKSYNPNPQFCSLKCRYEFQMAPVPFEKAKKLYESGMTQVEVATALNTTQKVIYNLFRRNKYRARKAFKRNQYGSKNSYWGGNQIGYAACHKRLESLLGKPQRCGVCGTTDPKKHYDWANLTGNYTDINDYKRMCRSCHWKYDRKINNIHWMWQVMQNAQ